MSTRCLRFWETFCLKFYVFPAKQKHPRDPCIIQYHSISFTPQKNVRRISSTKWRLTYHVDVHDTVENEPEILATIALSFLSHQKKCPNEFLERSDWTDKITIWKKCLCRCVGLMSEMKTCSVPHFGDGCNKMCKPHTDKKKVTPGISKVRSYSGGRWSPMASEHDNANKNNHVLSTLEQWTKPLLHSNILVDS